MWAIPANLQDENVLEEVGSNPHLVQGPPPRLCVVSPRMESSPPPLTCGPCVGQAQPPGWPTGQRAAGLVVLGRGLVALPARHTTHNLLSIRVTSLAHSEFIALSPCQEVASDPAFLTGTLTEAHGGGFQYTALA